MPNLTLATVYKYFSSVAVTVPRRALMPGSHFPEDVSLAMHSQAHVPSALLTALLTDIDYCSNTSLEHCRSCKQGYLWL